MMETFIVDAFTNNPFKGNPAGVCLLSHPISEKLMLSIAQELNLSETAFVQHNSKNNYSIRYFSPIMEIPLCGHATLASAKVLFENTALDEIHFTTFENLDLIVQKENDEIKMEFPVYETEKATVNSKMLDALGIEKINNCVLNTDFKILILEIKDSNKLAALKPNFSALLNSHDSISGVAVTSLSIEKEFDFQSRYFWPWSGSNEDPVTGVLHTILAKYWSKKLGKTTLTALQASKRTGILNLELINNNRIIIKGEAVIVFKGNLII